jgi:hypothetical protein
MAQRIRRDRARRTSPGRRIESVRLTEIVAKVRLVRKSTPQSNVAQWYVSLKHELSGEL